MDKYSWVDLGSSYLPSELQAAYLYAQIKDVDIISQRRMNLWKEYYRLLFPLAEKRKVDLPIIPNECKHNAHMFYIKVANFEERTALLSFLHERNIHAVFHYVPLHSSVAGKKYGRFFGGDLYTTHESERLVRLPLYFQMTKKETNVVVKTVRDFF